MKTELILAVKATTFPDHLRTTGFHEMSMTQIMEILNTAGLWLGPRYQLEYTATYRQIIPYIVLKQGDKIVHYTRTVKGGESHLHSKVSIGLGGHIDAEDIVFGNSHIQLPSTLYVASKREVLEELGENTLVDTNAWAGLILDYETHVGMVHIGVVAVWELLSGLEDSVVEDNLSSVKLDTPGNIYEQQYDRLEDWSRMVLESSLFAFNRPANIPASKHIWKS